MINNFFVDYLDVFFLFIIFGISNLIFILKVVMKILRFFIMKVIGIVFLFYLEIYVYVLFFF